MPRETGEKIDAWAGNKLWIYNNNYGMEVESVLNDIAAHIGKHHTDVIIIDNLMSLDISKMHGEKYDKQSILVLKLSDMAKRRKVDLSENEEI